MYTLEAGDRTMYRRLVSSTNRARLSDEKFRFFFVFAVLVMGVGKAF